MTKKKTNWFLRLITILFIIFIGLYIASESGYYEAKINKKVLLTDEAIKQFEEDVSNGKEVDLNTYIKTDTNDYSNAFTKAGDKLSKVTEEVLTGGISDVWEFIKLLFT